MGKPKPDGQKPPSELTVGLIFKVLEDNPATIVIDALDECDPNTRHGLFETLDHIVRTSPNVVKIFLTSRNDGDIVCRLATTPNIYIGAQQNRADITRFIQAEVQRAISSRHLLNGNVSAELQQRVVGMLSQGAQGMYV